MTAPDAAEPPDPADPAAARATGAPQALPLPPASPTPTSAPAPAPPAPTDTEALPHAHGPVASAGLRRRELSRRALLPLAVAATALAACTPDSDDTATATTTGGPPEDGSPTETDGSFTSTPGEEPVPGVEDVDAGDPQPFTDAQLDADYPSDRTVDHVPILSGFTILREEHPEVLEENLDRALRINRDADEQEAAAAVTDHYGDMSYTMADGLGEQLGAIYQAAVDAGRLPRTTQLIRQDGGRARNVSTARAKEHFDYDRPFVAAPEEHVPRRSEEHTSALQPRGHLASSPAVPPRRSSDLSSTMADGLGEQLGAIYQAAVDAGRLPRTTQLIRQDGGRARNVSTARAKEHFDYDRPFVAAPEEHVPR